MTDYIKEAVLNDLEYGEVDIDYLTDELYESELNFNNADPTSGQRCWEKWQIEEQIKKVLEDEKKKS